jgi:hypothetical protein
VELAFGHLARGLRKILRCSGYWASSHGWCQHFKSGLSPRFRSQLALDSSPPRSLGRATQLHLWSWSPVKHSYLEPQKPSLGNGWHFPWWKIARPPTRAPNEQASATCFPRQIYIGFYHGISKLKQIAAAQTSGSERHGVLSRSRRIYMMAGRRLPLVAPPLTFDSSSEFHFINRRYITRCPWVASKSPQDVATAFEEDRAQ